MVSTDNGVALPYRTFCFKILENVKECKRAFTCIYSHLSDRYKRSEKCTDIIFYSVLSYFGGDILRVPLFQLNDAVGVEEWERLNFHQDTCT